MILVTLGTQDKPFPRLIEAVEKQIELGNITDKVIVQAGQTKYESKVMEVFDFLPIDELEKLVDKANVIIMHAGVSSIIKGLQKSKKMIVTARLESYGEHVNNHQLEILESFASKKYIIPCYDLDRLDLALNELKDFKTKKYESNKENFVNLVKDIIDK